MDESQWSRIQDLFHQALDLPESQRTEFLLSACGGDPELVAQVKAMLTEDRSDTSILDRGLTQVAYEMVGSPLDFVSEREFGPYRLKRMLGRGGMGVVWLAERIDAGNLVAIKFLPDAAFASIRRVRFANEIRTLGKLQHPLIAHLYDAGTLADGTPWFVMEYVKGEAIDEYCAHHEVPIEKRLRIFRDACEAVQHAHSQAILHRDLKPSNIFVAQDGTPKLLDFGIAKELEIGGDLSDSTVPSLRFLSWDYAAPEWMRQGIQGLYTDVYALGVVLYKLLSGRLPFDRAKIPAVEFPNYIATHDPERPSLAAARAAADSGAALPGARLARSAWADLDLLCLKAMHRDVKQRYATVDALIRDIDHFLNLEPLEARPDSVSYKVSKFVQRHPRAVIAVVSTILLIAGLTTFFTIRVIRERDRAVAEAARTRRIQRFMLNLVGGSDQSAGPSSDLRVVTLLDHGVQEASSLSPDPESQGDLYQNLGNMYDKLGDFPKAEKLLNLALERKKNLPHSDQAKTAEVLVQIGLLQGDESNFDDGEATIQKAIDLLKGLPADDPNVIAAKAALGKVHAEHGDMKLAISMLEPIVQRKTVSSEEDYTLSDCLSYLAIAHFAIGEHVEAEKLLQRALDLDRRLYGPTHPQVATDLMTAGMDASALNKDGEAESDYRQAITILKNWYGPNYPELADDEVFLSALLQSEGKDAEAESLSRTAAAFYERFYQPEDGHAARPLQILGRIALKRKQPAEAEALLAHAKRSALIGYGDDGFQTAQIEVDLGKALLMQKNYAEAERVLAEAVKNSLKWRVPSEWGKAEAQFTWGRALAGLKRYGEAEEQISAALKRFSAEPNVPVSKLDEVRQGLIEVYEASHEPAMAAKVRSQLGKTADASK